MRDFYGTKCRSKKVIIFCSLHCGWRRVSCILKERKKKTHNLRSIFFLFVLCWYYHTYRFQTPSFITRWRPSCCFLIKLSRHIALSCVFSRNIGLCVFNMVFFFSHDFVCWLICDEMVTTYMCRKMFIFILEKLISTWNRHSN